METAKIGEFGQKLGERLEPIAKAIEAITAELLHEHFQMAVPTPDEEDILTCVLRNVADLSPSATAALTGYARIARMADAIPPPEPKSAPIPILAVNIEHAGYAKPVGKPVPNSRNSRRKKK